MLIQPPGLVQPRTVVFVSTVIANKFIHSLTTIAVSLQPAFQTFFRADISTSPTANGYGLLAQLSALNPLMLSRRTLLFGAVIWWPGLPRRRRGCGATGNRCPDRGG